MTTNHAAGPRPCRDCGTTEDVRSYGLCQPCGFARGVAERAAQGLGPHCTHGPTLERIATLMGVGPTPASALPAASSAVPSGRALGRAGSSSGGDAHLTGSSGKAPLPSAGTTRTPAPTTKNGRTVRDSTPGGAPAPTTAAG